MTSITLDVPAYAEPVQPSTLRSGEVYFSLTFFDYEMLIPVIETIVYLERTLDEQFVFQDAASFQLGDVASGEEQVERRFFVYSEASLNSVFDGEHLIHGLLRCLRGRNGSKR